MLPPLSRVPRTLRAHLYVEGTDEFKQTLNNNLPKDKVQNVSSGWGKNEFDREWRKVSPKGATAEASQLGPSAHSPACGRGTPLPEERCCSLAVTPEPGPRFRPGKARGDAAQLPALLFTGTRQGVRVPPGCGVLTPADGRRTLGQLLWRPIAQSGSRRATRPQPCVMYLRMGFKAPKQ